MRKNEFYTVEELVKDLRKRVSIKHREVEYELANDDVMIIRLSYRKYHIARYNKFGKLVSAIPVKTDGDVVAALKEVMEL